MGNFTDDGNRRRLRDLFLVFFCCIILEGCGESSPVYLTEGQSTEGEDRSALSDVGGEDGRAAESAVPEIRPEASADETGGACASENASASGGSQGNSDVCVYVCGAVKVPGVYYLGAGARVGDAVEAAGGMNKKAAQEAWNLAEPLTDGQMIHIPTAREYEQQRAENAGSGDGQDSGSLQQKHVAAAEDPAPDSSVAEADRININTADSGQLQQIPGVGAARAQAIVAYRQESGGFSRVEDIMKVSGIGEGIFSRIKDYITV